MKYKYKYKTRIFRFLLCFYTALILLSFPFSGFAFSVAHDTEYLVNRMYSLRGQKELGSV